MAFGGYLYKTLLLKCKVRSNLKKNPVLSLSHKGVMIFLFFINVNWKGKSSRQT